MAAVGLLIADRYRLVRPVAAGGTSQVWLGVDENLNRPVALKRCGVPGGLTPGEQDLVRAWALREARAFASVRHTNVIHTLDVLPDGGEPWLVMEYVPSRSLQQVIDESGPLPPARVAAIGLAVLDGLVAAERAGVLHLDVKPANVLIADDGRVVLTDFGPAVTGEGLGALADAGIVLGSPKSVAPDRLTGGPPYARETTEDTLRALVDAPPDPPGRAGPLAPVLAGLLQRDPAARSTATETAARLRAVAGPPQRQAPAPDAGRAGARWRRLVQPVVRRRAAVVAVMVVMLATLTPVAAGSDRGTPSPATADRPVVPAGSPFVLPGGFQWWNDPSGLRVAVPQGWRQSGDGRGVLQFGAPQGQPSLRISAWAPAPPNAVAAFLAEERDVQLPAYRRIRIEALPGSPDAVWEYTYVDDRAGPMRGLQRVLVDGDRTYLIEWRAPKASWAAGLQSLAVVLASFRPPPGA
jgi:hypothetical protein